MKNKKNKTPFSEDSNIKKSFYKSLLYIALSIIPLYFFSNERGFLRYVCAGFFIFILVELIKIIQLSPNIINAFFPTKVRFEKEVKPFDNFIYKASPYFFFASMVLILCEIRIIDNTIHGTELLFTYGFYGFLAGLIFIYILKLISPTIYFESNRRYAIIFISVLGFSLISAASASFINHTFSEEPIKSNDYLIMRKSLGGRKNNNPLLFLAIEKNSEERIEISKNLYNEVNEGEKATLFTQKGLLGYQVVIDVKSKD
jgi:hypothetical protein